MGAGGHRSFRGAMKKTGIAMVLLVIAVMGTAFLLAPAARTQVPHVPSTSSTENVSADTYVSTDVYNVAAAKYEPSRK